MSALLSILDYKIKPFSQFIFRFKMALQFHTFHYFLKIQGQGLEPYWLEEKVNDHSL